MTFVLINVGNYYAVDKSSVAGIVVTTASGTHPWWCMTVFLA